jgi:hypothetical protein
MASREDINAALCSQPGRTRIAEMCEGVMTEIVKQSNLRRRDRWE